MSTSDYIVIGIIVLAVIFVGKRLFAQGKGSCG